MYFYSENASGDWDADTVLGVPLEACEQVRGDDERRSATAVSVHGDGWLAAQSPMYEIERLSVSHLRACFETKDPAAANFFMLPHRSTCVMHVILPTMHQLCWGCPAYDGYAPPGEAAAREVVRNYTEPLFNRMRARWPYFNASGGADHLMSFGHGRGLSWFASHMSEEARAAIMRVTVLEVSPARCERCRAAVFAVLTLPSRAAQVSAFSNARTIIVPTFNVRVSASDTNSSTCSTPEVRRANCARSGFSTNA